MHSDKSTYRLKAAEAAAQIAILDLPTDSWPGVVTLFSDGVTKDSNDYYKESCLVALSELCVGSNPDTLAAFSFEILFAIITGMDSPHEQLQLVATKALANAIQFSESNFAEDAQRNSIMTLVTRMAKSTNDDIRLQAFICMVNIAISFYSFLGHHMLTGLYTDTLTAIQSDPNDEVVMQAIEFWSSICEEETNIFRENEAAVETGAEQLPCHNFIQGVISDLAPHLFAALSRGELDPELEDTTVVSSASACISLIASTLGNGVVAYFIDHISTNINSPEEDLRTASILCFGSIMDGPSTERIAGVIFEALPVLFTRAVDEAPVVKHTTMWCLDKIAEFHPAAIGEHLPTFLGTACNTFTTETPAIAASAANAIQALAQHVLFDKREESPLNDHLENLFKALTDVSDRPDADDASLRISAYSAIRALVTATPDSQIHHIQTVIDIFAPRLQSTIGSAIDSGLQGELVGITCSCVHRLGPGGVTETLADTLMDVYVELLRTRNGVSGIFIEVFMAAGAVCNAVGEGFNRYMGTLADYLLAGLEQWHDAELCSQALALTSAICYALKTDFAPYCDKLVGLFIEHLNRGNELPESLGPLIVNNFADIAFALQGGYMNYLPSVMDNLQRYHVAACKCTDEMTEWPQIELTNQWRAALLSNFSIVLQSCCPDNSQTIRPYVNSMTRLLTFIAKDRRREDDVNRLACGLIYDIMAEFPELKTTLQNYDPFLQYCLSSSQSDDLTREAAQNAIDRIHA